MAKRKASHLLVRPRARPHSIIRNGSDIIATFPSACLAEEAMNDLGCYTDCRPKPEDIFTVEPAK